MKLCLEIIYVRLISIVNLFDIRFPPYVPNAIRYPIQPFSAYVYTYHIIEPPPRQVFCGWEGKFLFEKYSFKHKETPLLMPEYRGVYL